MANGNPGFSSTELAQVKREMSAIERVLVQGNLNELTPEQRVTFYNRTCESLGLNQLTRPFDYLNLNGKLQLYARKDCTDQLRSLRRVSVQIVAREVVEGVYVVTARASMPDGRQDESIGAVTVEGLKGENKANACMKAETKAKRRVTLSICGLGMLDEGEVETIPGVRVQPAAPPPAQLPPHDPETGEVVDPPPVAGNPVFDAYAKAMAEAPDEAAMKAIGAKVAAEQKRGNLSLEERAKLVDLRDARKAALAEAARNKPDATLDAPPGDAWGVTGSGEREPGAEG